MNALRTVVALFHCMVRHGTVQYGSLLAGSPLGAVLSTRYFFSTTSARVPSDPYHCQNVTCKLYWSLIGWRKSSLLRHWTCDMRPNIDPLDLNQHSQRMIGRNFCLNKRTFLYQPKNSCFVVYWGSTDQTRCKTQIHISFFSGGHEWEQPHCNA